jgi:hypothetical protein
MGLLLLGGLIQLFRSGSAMTQATRDAGGAIAESIATSAIEEAIWHFQKKVNDPNDPMFKQVRCILMEGNEPTIDLTAACLPTLLQGYLDESPHRGFYRNIQIESMQVSLRSPMRVAAIAKLPASEAAKAVLPGEQFLDLNCAVRLQLRDVTIWRRVFLRRRYGITFISPYKPFDTVTFAILESAFLHSLPRLMQRFQGLLTTSEEIGRTLGRLQGSLKAASTSPGSGKIRLQPRFLPLGYPPPLPPQAQEDIARVRSELGPRHPTIKALEEMPPIERGWAEWGLIRGRPGTQINRPPPTSGVPPDLSWLRLNTRALAGSIPHPSAVIFSTAPRVRLEDFDYEVQIEQKITPEMDSIEAAAEIYNQALTGVLGTSDRPLSENQIRHLEQSASRLRETLRVSLPIIVRTMNGITKHLREHTTIGLTSAVVDAYRARGSQRLQNLAYHTDTLEEVEELRQALPAFNGHLNLNGLKPLTLNFRNWRGKTVISSPWRKIPVPITLENLLMEDPTRDLVTLNFDEARLRSGTIQASVFLRTRAVFEGSPRIQGNLILRYLAMRSARSSLETLRGEVEYDPRIASGGFWLRADGEKQPQRLPSDLSLGHYTVGLCPRFQQRAVLRSPGAAGLTLARKENS